MNVEVGLKLTVSATGTEGKTGTIGVDVLVATVVAGAVDVSALGGAALAW